MLLLGIDHVAITGADLAKSCDFYDGLFGIPAFWHLGGPCAADANMSDIGGLLPISLCGRTSLQSLRQQAGWDTQDVGKVNPKLKIISGLAVLTISGKILELREALSARILNTCKKKQSALA